MILQKIQPNNSQFLNPSLTPFNDILPVLTATVFPLFNRFLISFFFLSKLKYIYFKGRMCKYMDVRTVADNACVSFALFYTQSISFSHK